MPTSSAIDVRVYQSDLVSREYTHLAERYLAELKRLTARFLVLRIGAALAQVIGLGLALTAAFALLGRGQLSVASFAVLIPGISMLSGMINSFLYQYRSLRESLLYAETLFDFLGTSFDPVADPSETTPLLVSASRLDSIQLEGISYTYPETQKERQHQMRDGKLELTNLCVSALLFQTASSARLPNYFVKCV